MDWLDRFHIYFVSAASNQQPDNWFYHYQTVISAAVALLAAVLTVGVIWIQIAETKRNHRELIERQYRSVRANLPLSLSELFDYGEQCIEKLSDAMRGRGEADDIRIDITPPILPKGALANLTENIEFSEEVDAIKLQQILRFIQIQNSRFRSSMRSIRVNRPPSHHTGLYNLRHDVLDAFILLSMAGHVFPYARLQQQHIPTYDKSDGDFSGAHRLGDLFDIQTAKYVVEHIHGLTKAEFEHEIAED